eukprot:4064818-Prymnesium_polylepis.1
MSLKLAYDAVVTSGPSVRCLRPAVNIANIGPDVLHGRAPGKRCSYEWPVRTPMSVRRWSDGR